MQAPKQWYPTLNSALDSQGLTEYWPLGSNINYGQTVSHMVQTGTKIKRGKEVPVMKFISVYRNEVGSYEAPISYFA